VLNFSATLLLSSDAGGPGGSLRASNRGPMEVQYRTATPLQSNFFCPARSPLRAAEPVLTLFWRLASNVCFLRKLQLHNCCC
jgi:hypothetical protein